VLIDPSPERCPNLFEARVEELIYHGDHTRTRVSACGRDDFIIKVPNAAGQVHLEVGAALEDRLARRGLPGAGPALSTPAPARARTSASRCNNTLAADRGFGDPWRTKRHRRSRSMK
jgi:hypothetical protein